MIWKSVKRVGIKIKIQTLQKPKKKKKKSPWRVGRYFILEQGADFANACPYANSFFKEMPLVLRGFNLMHHDLLLHN